MTTLPNYYKIADSLVLKISYYHNFVGSRFRHRHRRARDRGERQADQALQEGSARHDQRALRGARPSRPDHVRRIF